MLENRAPGIEVDLTKRERPALDYTTAFEMYMEKLQLLHEAPQEQYDKFFDDIDKMAEEGIRPDTCSYGNLFYDPKVGFSFIDVYPCANKEQRPNPSDIFNILLNHKFDLSGISLLPQERREQYNLMMRDLYTKITNGLIKYGYPTQEIKDFVDKAAHTFSVEECVPQANIEEVYKKRIEEKNRATRGFSIGL